MDITCDGVVIRETEYGESDKIVTFLCAEYRKITVMAKGVRSIKSKNSSAVQLFCASTFEMVEKNGRYTLKTASINDSFYSVRDNIERFALASYFADICNTVCSENNDEREMLRLLLNSFYAMAHFKEIPLWRIKCAFEMKCMQASGLAPDLSECTGCAKPAVDSTSDEGDYLFSPADGGFICPACLAEYGEKPIIPVGVHTVDALLYLLSSPQSRMLRFPLPDEPSVIYELCNLCERYLSVQAQKRFETLSFYKSVCVM